MRTTSSQRVSTRLPKVGRTAFTGRRGTVLAAALAVAGMLAAAPAPAQQAPARTNPQATEALFDAIFENDLAAVQSAVNAGADMSVRNDWGLTAIDLAVDKGYFEIAHFLLTIRNVRQQQADTATTSPGAQPGGSFGLGDARNNGARDGAPAAAPAPGVRSGPLPAVPTGQPAADSAPETAESGDSPFDAGAVTSGAPTITGNIRAPDGSVTPPPEPEAAPTTPRPTTPRATQPQPAPRSPEQSALPPAPAPEAMNAPQAAPPRPVPQSIAAPEPPAPQTAAPSMAETPPAAEPAALRTAEATPPTPQPRAAQPAIKPTAEPTMEPAGSATANPAVTDSAAVAGTAVTATEAPPDDSSFWDRLAGILPDNPFDDDEMAGETPDETEVAEQAPPEPVQPQPAPQRIAARQAPAESTATAAIPASPAPARLPARLGSNLRLGGERQSVLDARCVEKRSAVSFCVEPVDWPGGLSEAFTVSTVMYQGSQAIVRYEGGQATSAYALFEGEAFPAVSAWSRQAFGAPASTTSQNISVPGEPTAVNDIAVWRGTDPATGRSTTVEVRAMDNVRNAFPDRRYGVIRVFQDDTEPIFPQLSTMDLMVLR